MNRSFVKIFVAAGLLFGLVACNQKAEFTTSAFVAFGSSSVNVSEEVGSIEIPVYAYAKDGDYAFPRGDKANTTVTFQVVPGSAVENENYTFEPQNGVLNISDTSATSIKINVIDHDGEINNTADFKIRILSATNGYTLGGIRETTVTIQDADNPLAFLYGTYTASTPVLDVMSGSSTTLVLTLSPVDDSNSEVLISGMSPTGDSVLGLDPVLGTVSGNIITVNNNQVVGSYDGSDVFFCGLAAWSDTGFSFSDAPFIFNIDSENNSISAVLNYGFSWYVADEDAYGFTDAFFTNQEVVFTKQE